MSNISKVVMTRTTDTFVSLNRRAQIARNAKARVFVSIHLNAFNGTANGVETFLHTRSSASQKLAENVNYNMLTELGDLAGRTITNRGVKKANFAVLRGTYQHMLSILPEVLFMDNRRDHNVIKHKDFAVTAAAAIADGIRETVKGEKNVVVVVDAGHGGHDPGTSGFGYVEKDVALDIALALRDNLQGKAARRRTTSSSSSISSRSNNVKWIGTNDKGKELIVDTATLNYYDSQRWSDPTGSKPRGYKWKIDNLYEVNGSRQYRVQDENGNLYFTSARSDLVKIGGTYSNSGKKLDEDGHWGRATTRALQRRFNTPVDGEIWGQYRGNQAAQAITQGVKFGTGGSPVIKALQRHVGAKQDGILGKETVTKLQQHLGMKYVDGIISSPSPAIKEMQRRLNTGTF